MLSQNGTIFGICDKVRLKSVCSATETTFEAFFGIFFIDIGSYMNAHVSLKYLTSCGKK